MANVKELESVTPHQRLQGSLPKIGIRPVIDGRRKGVRESLEKQTMQMAQNVAKFLSEHLRHANGLPVACVIPSACIGGAAEAAESAELFRRESVGVSLTVTPCWCYGTEVMDAEALIPKAIWGFNGTERPGAVYLAAALAGYAQKGLPAFGIYGREVQDAGDETIPADVREKLLAFARALAHDPQVLILDEATSSVDTETEIQIRQAIDRVKEGRTSIEIAHRLSTIQKCDKILVMHKGRVREVGTHQELLARRGLYYKLYQLQYKDQEIVVPGD